MVTRTRAYRTKTPPAPLVAAVRTMALRVLHLSEEFERSRWRFEDEDALYAFAAIASALDRLWERRRERYEDIQAAAAIDTSPTKEQQRDGVRRRTYREHPEAVRRLYLKGLGDIYRRVQNGKLGNTGYRKALLSFARAVCLTDRTAPEVAALLYLTPNEITACRGPVEAAAEVLGRLRGLAYSKMLKLRNSLPVGSAPIEGGVFLPDAPIGEYLLRHILGLFSVSVPDGQWLLERWRETWHRPQCFSLPNLRWHLADYDEDE